MFENALGKNHGISRILIEELHRNGVDLVCISPGSRSTPLVLAAAEHDGLKKVVHVDERGAAFYAVGYARATGRPAALICTSGTAVANYLPAIVEASQSCIPLIVITADRPFELHETRSNQTIKQRGIFGEFVRWECELPPFTEEVAPRALLSSLDYALYCASRSPAGPVHLNMQFRKPLIASDEGIPSVWEHDIAGWINSKAPLTTYLEEEGRPGETTLKHLEEVISSSRRGVITVGELAPRFQRSDAFVRLADHLGWPLLCDITSGLRFNGITQGFSCHASAYLDAAGDLFTPDVILHFGGSLVSNSTNAYLERGEHLVHIHDQAQRQDPSFKVRSRVVGNPELIAEAVQGRIAPHPSKLKSVVATLEDTTRTIIERFSPSSLSEIQAVRTIVGAAPKNSSLYLANSLPVREGDMWVGASDQELLLGVHRGVSGIDGTLSAASGFAHGNARLTTLITGDLSFLHDINSLLLIRESKEPIITVIFNNDGGAIFSFLPTIPSLPHFERYFQTPHGLRFEEAARLFSLPYYSPTTIQELVLVYERCVNEKRSAVIEIVTSKSETYTHHRELKESISRTVREISQ